MKDQFPYTQEGYLEAKKYLEEIGQWTNASTRGFSTDGWSIIQLANDIYSKQNQPSK